MDPLTADGSAAPRPPATDIEEEEGEREERRRNPGGRRLSPPLPELAAAVPSLPPSPSPELAALVARHHCLPLPQPLLRAEDPALPRVAPLDPPPIVAVASLYRHPLPIVSSSVAAAHRRSLLLKEEEREKRRGEEEREGEELKKMKWWCRVALTPTQRGREREERRGEERKREGEELKIMKLWDGKESGREKKKGGYLACARQLAPPAS